MGQEDDWSIQRVRNEQMEHGNGVWKGQGRNGRVWVLTSNTRSLHR